MIKKHWLYPKKRPPLPTAVAYLDVEKLTRLFYLIHMDTRMPIEVRCLNSDRLLDAAEIIRRCEIDRLVSVTQAAKIRGVTRQTIWKLLKSGSLTPYKVAGHTVIDRDELAGLPPKGELRLTRVRFRHVLKV